MEDWLKNKEIKGNAYNTFLKNYNDMRKDNTKFSDKYFHSKANCEAGQIRDFTNALGIDVGRELYDFSFNNPFRKKLPLKTSIKDCIEDFDADMYGLGQGLLYPDADCRDLVKKYRVKGINEKY